MFALESEVEATRVNLEMWGTLVAIFSVPIQLMPGNQMNLKHDDNLTFQCVLAALQNHSFEVVRRDLIRLHVSDFGHVRVKFIKYCQHISRTTSLIPHIHRHDLLAAVALTIEVA